MYINRDFWFEDQDVLSQQADKEVNSVKVSSEVRTNVEYYQYSIVRGRNKDNINFMSKILFPFASCDSVMFFWNFV